LKADGENHSFTNYNMETELHVPTFLFTVHHQYAASYCWIFLYQGYTSISILPTHGKLILFITNIKILRGEQHAEQNILGLKGSKWWKAGTMRSFIICTLHQVL